MSAMLCCTAKYYLNFQSKCDSLLDAFGIPLLELAYHLAKQATFESSTTRKLRNGNDAQTRQGEKSQGTSLCRYELGPHE
jgi:hypothetical protein